jgi:hypothetical protein
MLARAYARIALRGQQHTATQKHAWLVIPRKRMTLVFDC